MAPALQQPGPLTCRHSWYLLCSCAARSRASMMLSVAVITSRVLRPAGALLPASSPLALWCQVGGEVRGQREGAGQGDVMGAAQVAARSQPRGPIAAMPVLRHQEAPCHGHAAAQPAHVASNSCATQPVSSLTKHSPHTAHTQPSQHSTLSTHSTCTCPSPPTCAPPPPPCWLVPPCPPQTGSPAAARAPPPQRRARWCAPSGGCCGRASLGRRQHVAHAVSTCGDASAGQQRGATGGRH